MPITWILGLKIDFWSNLLNLLSLLLALWPNPELLFILLISTGILNAEVLIFYGSCKIIISGDYLLLFELLKLGFDSLEEFFWFSKASGESCSDWIFDSCWRISADGMHILDESSRVLLDVVKPKLTFL